MPKASSIAFAGSRPALTALLLFCFAFAGGGTAGAEEKEGLAGAPDSWALARVSAGHAGMSGPGLAEHGYRWLPVPAGVDRGLYLSWLRSQPGVENAEFDVLVLAADMSPNDTFYETFQSSYLRPIGSEGAWDLVTGSDAVTVAMLDTGIDYNHPDLASQMWTNPAEIPGNGVDDDGNGCVDDVHGCKFVNLTSERASFCGYQNGSPDGSVVDDHGLSGAPDHSHGTMVAGVLGARGNNGIGITGVAWNVRLMAVKVLDCGLPSFDGRAAGDLSNVAQGIDYARRMGADIINVSLSTVDSSVDLQVLRDAILAAQADGVLIVAASGNHTPGSTSVSPGFPAAYSADPQFPNVVAVGAAEKVPENSWATYSNYGPAIDLAAPGSNLASTTRTDIAPATSYGAGAHGTSFAAPIVSGLFALLMGRNSGLTVPEYIEYAKAAASAATPAPHGQNWAGAGVVDLARAARIVPMTLSGVALHDWLNAPQGSEVRAVVNGQDCGRDPVTVGQISEFAVAVVSDEEKAGCGSVGRSVIIFIGGAEAQPSIPWGDPYTDLYLQDVEVSSVSPPPGLVVVQSLQPGWNNIAHFGPPGDPQVALGYLPLDWQEARLWLAGNADAPGEFLRYISGIPDYANNLDGIDTYDAVWTLVDVAANVAIMNPGIPVQRQLVLGLGWNNFVYTGTSSSVDDALESVDGRYIYVAWRNNFSGDWEMHTPGFPRFLNDLGGLLTFQVYWVFMTQSGVLVMR